ncbi:transglycosylase SLT domain-containing protein [Rhizobium laguerreae]|uniref:transglycosylase SLT domain-containing protein n=1 Tax=Rhizobium laguerreae TaxID=1076926 RepID=UPI001C907B28|nr:transglycosylase SLT domain-containing protein [Rhizobium laguerreae]MBY3476072.1 transglycosylase SLT domain-containing protein [Rhizobium laguerreae]MBY3521090.1 transglycosylase SLT domain-containing protein [Rhizobium laguerreae]
MGFIFGGDTGQSQESVTDARKRLAAAMLQQGTNTGPIQSPWEGAARMAQALMGGLAIRKQGEAEQAGMAEGMAALTGQPYSPPEKPAGFLSSIFGGNKAANPGATGSSMPTVDAGGNIPVATAPDDVRNLIAANVPPEMQGYATNLIGKESSFNPNAVSPTGATGLAQFTRGTGSQYGLVSDRGDMRKDPVANLKALVALTNDNRAGLTNALGRAPTDGELALAHQQGLQGAINLLSGKSVPGNNLSVNNVDPNMDPRAAANKIMAFYGGSGGQQGAPAGGMPSAPPIQPPPVNPPAPPPTPGYIDPMVAPNAPPMPQAAAPGEVASLDPSIGIPMPGAAGQMRASAPAQPMPPQGAPQAALPPLPASAVGPTPNVASVPPVGMPSSQIPPEFQNSQQLMNADPNSGIMPALLGGSPASSEQVAQAQQSGQARLAQALGSASAQQAANPMANPRAQALVKVLSNPNVPAPMKAMAAQSLQTLMKPPEYGFQTLPDGTILRSDPRTGTVQPIYQSTPKPIEVNGRLVGADGKVIADFSNGQWERMSDGTLYNKSTGEIRQAPGGAGGEKFYGSTVPYYDKDGNLRYRQLGDKGGGKDLDFGPGATAAPTTRTVDTGTELITLGPGGQEVKRTTKENYEAAKDTAQGSTEGKAAGEAVSSLPADLMQADQTIKNINELLTSKGLNSIVGSVDQFRPSWTMGADGRDALTRLKQLQGGAFLQAYGLLKGGGQITEVEGGKAQDAMARMDRSLDEPHFRAALKDFRDAVEQGVAKMKQRAKVAAPAASADPAVVPTDIPGVTIRRKQ